MSAIDEVRPELTGDQAEGWVDDSGTPEVSL